jgi:hypothetical protein
MRFVTAGSAWVCAAMLIGCSGAETSGTLGASAIPAAGQTLTGKATPPGIRRTSDTAPCSATGAGSFLANAAGNVAAELESSVLGGLNNTECDPASAIGAGEFNVIHTTGGLFNFIGGGEHNSISSGSASSIGAGESNSISGTNAMIGGGNANRDSGVDAFIGGGESNNVTGTDAVIAAGSNNTGSGPAAFIGAGQFNTTDTGAQYGVVGGGFENYVGAVSATVAGGYQNKVFNRYAFIGGGDGNTVNADFAVIAGGLNNDVTGEGGYVAAGGYNFVSGTGAVIDGGFNNAAAGSYATVPGGYVNSASGTYSFAAGARASAAQNGTFVWSDGSDGDTILTSTRAYQFLARASGGFTLWTNAASTVGATLAPGSGTWSSTSDRNVKTDVVRVDESAVLDKVARLPINRWSYITEHGVRHVGPMAQDFYAAFGVGEDDKHITSIDEDGVALAAIKALHAENVQLRTRLAAVTTSQAVLQSQIQRLTAEWAQARAGGWMSVRRPIRTIAPSEARGRSVE